jgi:thymidylate synthase ThyX
VTNKQGGSADAPSISLEVAGEFKRRGLEATRSARELYTWAVERGIEKGQARIFNTQNQYTKVRYTGSLKNFFDFLYLRLPPHVLWECRKIAESILTIIMEFYPDVVSSWRNLVYDGVKLSSKEKETLRTFFDSADLKLDELCSEDDTGVYQILKKIGAI